MDTTDFAVEWVSIDSVHPNPSNPRQNDAAVGPVADSLRRFGWQQPIVARPSGEVVAGHTRLLAARDLGMGKVPVLTFQGSDLDAVAFGIADNKTHEYAEWDEEALKKLLGFLEAEDALAGVGFTDEELAALLHADESEGEASEVAPEEPPEDPVSRLGDLWSLGGHRLLVGDSRDPSSYTQLLQGEHADLVWSDPPYGVGYQAKAGSIQNDTAEGLYSLLRASLGMVVKYTRPGAVWYVAAPAGPQFLDFAVVLKDLGVWRQTLVWVKNSLVLGHSDFHYRHEAIFFGWTPGAPHQTPPDRKQDTIWEFDRPSHSPDHPTMKPVALVAHALGLSSKKGDLVVDPFLGSGTTLIASEQLGRRCCGIELDPRYADVIVRRWEEMTGGEAQLESGQTFHDSAIERSLA